MKQESEFILVLTTVSNSEKAEEIAKKLVEERVSSCVTIVPARASFYWWEGKIEREEELVLLIKTRFSLYKKLEELLLSLHPYTVPEIIAFPIIEGFKKYLDWLRKETT